MDEKIKYSDLISADDSIENLIAQLELLNKTIGNTSELVKNNAAIMAKGLNSVTGATQQGRTAISQAADTASKLEMAYKKLAEAQTEEGRTLAFVKSQINDTNRATVEELRMLKSQEGSYEELRMKLSAAVNEYKRMSAVQRDAGGAGDVLLTGIHNLQNELSVLDTKLKPTIAKVSELTKLKRRLADTVERLGAAQSKESKDLSTVEYALKRVTEQQKAKVALDAQMAASGVNKIDVNKLEVYSYDLLSAAYRKMKLDVNAMTAADDAALKKKRETENELKAIYQQMIKLQEATGRHTLSVGNYGKVWNGLGYSVQQVVRELPAAAISMNTLFLAMSNNIPIVVDEWKKLKASNEAAQKAGLKTVSAFGTLLKSIFSLQTAMMLIITAFSMYGDKIIEVGARLLGFNSYVEDADAKAAALSESIRDNNDAYGKNVVLLTKLNDQWNNLAESDKAKWVKHNATLFERLGLAIRDVNEAEALFSSQEKLDAVNRSFYERAKSAAAAAVAIEHVKSALNKEEEANDIEREGTGLLTGVQTAWSFITGSSTGTWDQVNQRIVRRNALERRGEAEQLRRAARDYVSMQVSADDEARRLLEEIGIRPYEGEGHNSGGGAGSHKEATKKDLSDRIMRQRVELYRKMEESITSLYKDELSKRLKSEEASYNADEVKLSAIRDKNEQMLNGLGPKYKSLTDAQKENLKQQNAWIDAILSNEGKRLSIVKSEITYEKMLRAEMAKRGTLGGTSKISESINAEKGIRLGMLDNEASAKRLSNTTVENPNDPKAQAEREIEIQQWYIREKEKIEATANKSLYEIKLSGIEAQLNLAKKGSDDELRFAIERIKAQELIAIEANKLLDPTKQLNEADIRSKYRKLVDTYNAEFIIKRVQLEVKADKAKQALEKKSRRQRMVDELDNEEKILRKKLELADQLNLSDNERNAMQSRLTGIGTERGKLTGARGFVNGIGAKGVQGGILEQMGFDDEYISAMDDVTAKTLENINSIIDAEIQLAENEKRISDEKVENAQKALDAEIEARNNGYASDVAGAQARLDLEKKTQEKKAKILEQAQRRQERINSLTQASSMITATAQLWSTFSGMGPVGPALAIAAIAAMWTSFAVSKVKAKQLSKSQQDKYGDGGLEVLEGGSHASGNDIDLHTKNKRGHNMRAEGGEALAIINKRNTRKYSKLLPDIIDSLNKGNFEEKFTKAFSKGEQLQAIINTTNNVSLSKLESSVDAIRRQGSRQVIPMANGATMIIEGNVKRIVR